MLGWIPPYARAGVSALKRLSIYGAGNAAASLISLAATPVIARSLGPAAFADAAIFVYVLWVLNVLVSFNSVALFNVRVLKVPQHELTASVSSVFALTVATTVVLLLALLILKLTGFSHFVGVDIRYLLIALPVNVFSLLYQTNQSRQMFNKDAAGFAVSQFGYAFLAAAFSLALIFSWRSDELSRILGVSGAYVVMGLAATIPLARDGIVRLFFDRRAAVEALKFLLPLMPHMASVFVLNVLDRLLVASLAGKAAAGLYISAAFLTGSVGVFVSAINRALTPEIYEALRTKDQSAGRLIGKIFLRYAGAAALGSVAVWLLADVAVRILFGDKYAGAEEYLKWLFIGQAVWATYTLASSVLMFYEKSFQLSSITASTAAFHVLLMFVLFEPFGVLGFCYAFVFSMCARLVLTAILAKRAFRQHGRADSGIRS